MWPAGMVSRDFCSRAPCEELGLILPKGFSSPRAGLAHHPLLSWEQGRGAPGFLCGLYEVTSGGLSVSVVIKAYSHKGFFHVTGR